MLLFRPSRPGPLARTPPADARAARVGCSTSGVEMWEIHVHKVTSSYENHRLGATHTARLAGGVDLELTWVHVECLGSSGKDCRWDVSLRVAQGDVDVVDLWLDEVCDQGDPNCASMNENGPLPRKLEGVGPWALAANSSGFVQFNVSIQRRVSGAAVL